MLVGAHRRTQTHTRTSAEREWWASTQPVSLLSFPTLYKQGTHHRTTIWTRQERVTRHNSCSKGQLSGGVVDKLGMSSAITPRLLGGHTRTVERLLYQINAPSLNLKQPWKITVDGSTNKVEATGIQKLRTTLEDIEYTFVPNAVRIGYQNMHGSFPWGNTYV